MAGVAGLEPATPGFGGREALFGLILAHISRFDFSGFSALLQERATDPITLFLGPNLGPRLLGVPVLTCSPVTPPLVCDLLRSRPTHHRFDRNRYAPQCGITSDKRDYRMQLFDPRGGYRSAFPTRNVRWRAGFQRVPPPIPPLGRALVEMFERLQRSLAPHTDNF